MRMMHEASMHDENSFVTLTYADEHVPDGGSLRQRDMQLFFKRLRRAIQPERVRYFYVGEYGSTSGRPHYHALLFGFAPADQELFTVRGGFPVFTSALVDKLWPLGLHEIGSVTPQSAAYVAGYIRKRITGSWMKARYGDREPEFGRMSRNPGIGAGWIDEFHGEVFPNDNVVVRGQLVKPPRYYDCRVSRTNPLMMDSVKVERMQKRVRENESPERLAAMETVQAASERLRVGGSI